jgi:hypothetical protein
MQSQNVCKTFVYFFNVLIPKSKDPRFRNFYFTGNFFSALAPNRNANASEFAQITDSLAVFVSFPLKKSCNKSD